MNPPSCLGGGGFTTATNVDEKSESHRPHTPCTSISIRLLPTNYSHYVAIVIMMHVEFAVRRSPCRVARLLTAKTFAPPACNPSNRRFIQTRPISGRTKRFFYSVFKKLDNNHSSRVLGLPSPTQSSLKHTSRSEFSNIWKKNFRRPYLIVHYRLYTLHVVLYVCVCVWIYVYYYANLNCPTR